MSGKGNIGREFRDDISIKEFSRRECQTWSSQFRAPVRAPDLYIILNYVDEFKR